MGFGYTSTQGRFSGALSKKASSGGGIGGLNANTKLLLDLDGADTATSTTDASDSAHVISFAGTAQLDTSIKKFGSAALICDGDSDYISAPDSADWDVVGDASDWTIDLWAAHAALTGGVNSQYYIMQGEDGNNFWALRLEAGPEDTLDFIAFSTAPIVNLASAANIITDTNFHHISVIKVATEYGIYLDGVQVAYVNDASTDTYAGTLYMGANRGSNSFFDGNMDEVRVQKENWFSAAPNVGLTDTITVPTGPYTDER